MNDTNIKNLWGMVYLLLFFVFVIGYILLITMQEVTHITGKPIPTKIDKRG